MTVVPSASLGSEPTWKTYYAQAENALAQQEPAEAEQLFRKALAQAQSKSPDSLAIQTCLMKLADTLALRDKTAEAQSLYQRLLSILVKEIVRPRRSRRDRNRTRSRTAIQLVGTETVAGVEKALT